MAEFESREFPELHCKKNDGKHEMNTQKTFTAEEVIALCEMQIKQLEDTGALPNQIEVMKLFTLGLRLDMSIATMRELNA
jgi:hypothetical protein